MRKFTLLVTALAFAIVANAQTASTFEALTLVGTDTAYINYSNPGNDVGFTNGLVYYPCVYDTGFGAQYWSYGFAYSNMTDTITSGYMNQYAAKTGIGYGGSAKYAVAYGIVNSVKLQGAAAGQSVNGFYITNSTYAFNSMRDGDGFAKQFGDTTGTGLTTGQGTAPDWCKVLIHGYKEGVMNADTVEFYLADFRGTSSTDHIVNTWQWVNLLPLGHVDSVTFTMSSSDNNAFGMKTPAYFCIDNFTTNETGVGVAAVQPVAARVYPNPATTVLNIDLMDDNSQVVSVIDMKGSVVFSENITSKHIEINTSSLPSGAYILRLSGASNAAMRFIKE